MGKLAFVFPGQGAQKPGMGQDLYMSSPAAKEIFERLEKVRPGTISQCFSGTQEELRQTVNTQPCLFAAELSAASAFRAAGIVPDVLAGFSLGELTALTFAGCFSPEEGFRLVIKRAEMMDAAQSQAGAAGMGAVVKLKSEEVVRLCKEFSRVYPVNFNSPQQVVVAVASEEIEAFKEAVKQAGGRYMPLAVSVASHSPFMAAAACEMERTLAEVPLKPPEIPLLSNYTARPYEGDFRNLLARQMENPVRWQESVEYLAALGVDTIVEVGPGQTLCGLIARIDPSFRLLHGEDMASLENVVKGLGSC